jgi:hypothetical protein
MTDDRMERLQRALRIAKTKRDAEELRAGIHALEWSYVCKDPWYFFSRMALTKDEHGQGGVEEAYKPFPNYAYVREILKELTSGNRHMIPKSRQVMISWIISTYGLWWSLTHQAQLGLIQSKKEDDAGRLIQRIYGIWSRLPAHVKEANPCTMQKKPPQLTFPATDSTILGIPEGGDQIRSNTASWLFGDESAFQEGFQEAFIAAQPALEGGGWAVFASSAKAGPMFDMVMEPVKPGTYKVLVPSWHKMNGLTRWETESDWTILRLHYSADPRHDAEWRDDAAKKYGRHGVRSKGWKAEMEIDPGANLGQRVYDEFSRDTHIIPCFTKRNGDKTHFPPEEWPVFVGIDPGFRDPCAVVFMALDADGTWYIWDEIYRTESTPKVIAKLIKMKLGRREPEMFWIGHDAAQKTMAGGGESIQSMFADERIFTELAYGRIQAKIVRMSELLRLQNYGEPRMKVLERCRSTIMEFSKYRYPERTAEQLRQKDAGEKPSEKHNHAMDAIGNVVTSVADNYARRWSGAKPADYAWETIPERMRSARGQRSRTPRNHDAGQDHYWDTEEGL